MFKRYLKTAVGCGFLFCLYFLALSPVLVIRAELDRTQFVAAVVTWGILAVLFMVPAAAMIIRKVWFFKGQGEPVLLDLLQSLLLEVNNQDAPVQVKKQRKRLIARWRLDDRDWCERIEKTRMKRVYELWLAFDNSTKTVTMSDRYRSVDWDLSPIAVKTGWPVYGRPLFQVSTGSEWGVENYRDTRPEEYNFTPGEIKSPLMNTILKNGWNVRFSLL